MYLIHNMEYSSETGPMIRYANYMVLTQTTTHLCKDCVFSKQVWSDLKQWLGLTAIDIVPMTCSIHSYWRKCRAKIDKDRRKTFDGIMVYFWWNVWKERNRRIFQNKSLQPRQVALLCKEEIEQYQLTTGNNGWTHHS